MLHQPHLGSSNLYLREMADLELANNNLNNQNKKLIDQINRMKDDIFESQIYYKEEKSAHKDLIKLYDNQNLDYIKQINVCKTEIKRLTNELDSYEELGGFKKRRKSRIRKSRIRKSRRKKRKQKLKYFI